MLWTIATHTFRELQRNQHRNVWNVNIVHLEIKCIIIGVFRSQLQVFYMRSTTTLRLSATLKLGGDKTTTQTIAISVVHIFDDFASHADYEPSTATQIPLNDVTSIVMCSNSRHSKRECGHINSYSLCKKRCACDVYT